MPTMPKTPTKESIAALEAAIREWWLTQEASWLDDSVNTDSEETDLWDDLPEVDSKVAAKSTPLFEDHLGVKLDVRMIKPGGYTSINELVNELVPRMVAKVNRAILKARATAA